jgi:putative transcriptional regulator
MTEELESEICLRGHFLIAMPGLEDPNFFQTVSYVCEHNAEGAVGLVINRVHPELTGEAVFRDLEMTAAQKFGGLPIHLGGPVHEDEVFVLHGPPFGWEACKPVTSSVALSNSKDLLERLAQGEGPESFMITLGCAGWGPGQLESEIMANVWLSCPANEKILFDMPHDKKWEEAAKLIGIDVRLLSGAVGHA